MKKKDMGYVSKFVKEAIYTPHPEKHEDEFMDILLMQAKKYKGAVLNAADGATLTTVAKNRETFVNSNHGIWLLSREKEYFLSYEDFPWFKNVSVGKILNVVEPVEGHFYLPELDIDLDTEVINNPHRFPLMSKNN